MKKWWQLVVSAVVGLAIGLSVGAVFLGGGKERVAIVDVDRIFAESKLAEEYNERLKKEAEAKSQALAKMGNTQQRLDQQKKFELELTKLKQEYRTELLEEVDKVLARLAKRHGVDLVYVRGGAARYAKVDLTEETMKELEK